MPLCNLPSTLYRQQLHEAGCAARHCRLVYIYRSNSGVRRCQICSGSSVFFLPFDTASAQVVQLGQCFRRWPFTMCHRSEYIVVTFHARLLWKMAGLDRIVALCEP